MNQRQAQLLQAIIDQFITTALPVGSKRLLETSSFDVSPATIRSEMSFLEEEGFLEQPHVSAGRVPTVKGYRVYVEHFMKPTTHEKAVRKKFDSLKDAYLKRKDQERVYDAVSLLSRMIQNVGFATVPHRDRVYYMGLANVLRQPEFQLHPELASGVVEMLETKLTDLLSHVDITDETKYFIGDEHLLPTVQSCSLMVRRYEVRDFEGAVGILGPVRMDYGYNTVALDLAAELLRASSHT